MHVEVTDDELHIALVDGRRIFAPLVWYPRLLHASHEQRQNWRLIGEGEGINWPEIDEDLSVEGVVDGIPSLESPGSLHDYLRRASGDGAEQSTKARSKTKQSAVARGIQFRSKPFAGVQRRLPAGDKRLAGEGEQEAQTRA